MKTLYHNGKIISKGAVFAGSVLVDEGIITDVIASPDLIVPADNQINLNGAYLAPGFIDTHIHGCGGFGVDGDADDLFKMSEILLKQGVIAFTPTLYPTHDMAARLKKFAAVIGREKGAKITGFHLEGPFISADKPGVMNPADIRPVNVEDVKKLYDAAEGKISAITAAPELPGTDKLAAFAREKNFILQAGHTNATYAQMFAGADMGITHCTHIFNAMSPLNHRDPGAPGAALTDNRFTVELIADGAHLHPAIVKMVLMLKGPYNIVLVSDSINPAGLPKGRASGEDVLLKNGIFRRKADDIIAGSAITMLEGLQNLIKWGCPPEYASMAASDNPAKLHKLNMGAIAKNHIARFIVLDKNFNLQQVI